MKIFLFISTFLLSAIVWDQNLYFNRFYRSKSTYIQHPFKKGSDHQKIIYSIVTGQSQILSRDIKYAYQQLNLQHLLVPSGLHLSAFLLIPFIFIKNNWLRFLFLIFPLHILLMQSSGFYSLARSLNYKTLLILIPRKFLNLKVLFFLVFIFDLTWGNYKASPLSFAFSFIFWGSLVFSPNSIFQKIYWLSLAKLSSSFILQNHIFLESLLLSPLLTSIFSLLFPIYILVFLLRYIHMDISSIIYLNHQFIKFCSELCTTRVYINLFQFLIFFSPISSRLKIFLLLLISTTHLGEYEHLKFKSFPNKIKSPPQGRAGNYHFIKGYKTKKLSF